MTVIFYPDFISRPKVFNFLPLILAGAEGLGAGLFLGSRSKSKEPDRDDDRMRRSSEKQEKRREERRLQQLEEANQRMQEQMVAAHNEQLKQQELMKKRVSLESAIGKLDPIKLEEGQKDEENIQVSELYSDKLNNDWLDTITNYFKKRRGIKNRAFE